MKAPILMLLSSTKSGVIVATDGSMRTPRTAIISTWRNRKCSREKAYAALTPKATETSAVAVASFRLLKASSRNETGFSVGRWMARTNASRFAPGGMMLRLSGRAMLRGSRAMLTIHRIGNRTVKVTNRHSAWRRAWRPQTGRRRRRAATATAADAGLAIEAVISRALGQDG